MPLSVMKYFQRFSFVRKHSVQKCDIMGFYYQFSFGKMQRNRFFRLFVSKVLSVYS